MQRIVSAFSILAVTGLFAGLSLMSGGCSDPVKKPTNNAPTATNKGNTPLTNKDKTPEAAKALSFDTTVHDVKKGKDVKIMAKEGKVTGSETPDPKTMLTVTNDATSITVAAGATAPLGEVEITVKGDGKETAKVKVKVVE